MSVLADVRLGHEAVSNDSKKGVVFFCIPKALFHRPTYIHTNSLFHHRQFFFFSYTKTGPSQHSIPSCFSLVLPSTALCVWSWSYYKHWRSGPNRRQDPEEMDAFLVHLPHVSINTFYKEIRLVTPSL